MHTLIFGALLAVAQARFNQENAVSPIIAAVQGGQSGQAATLAGQSIGDLLAGANACTKLQLADQIVSELGTGADAVNAAIAMVTAEKNFNPFAQSIPTICSDPTLPATQMLRGITTKVDPSVGGAAVANALASSTAAKPLDATGKSVADLMAANGFSNFTTQDAAGNKGTPGSAGSATVAASSVAVSSVAATSAAAASTTLAGTADQCSAQVAAALASASAAASATTVASGDTSDDNPCDGAPETPASATSAAVSTSISTAGTGATAAGNSTGKTTIAGDDFGTCDPTMKFEGGLGGRPATEFTFQSQDPAIIAIQEEALNPNIITKRICDSLTNFCGANAAAKATCASALSQIQTLGTRDVTTAQMWNQLVGFAGVSTNPDGGPAAPASTQAAGSKMRRNWKA